MMSSGLITVFTTLFLSQLCAAFLPSKIESLGGALGVSHAEMTEEVIKEFQSHLFPSERYVIQKSTIDAALKEISRANAEVDHDQHHAEKHFDGESFPESQRRIEWLRVGLQEMLKSGDVTGARIALGQALHTIQDFYAHSNWVELGNTEPHPSLGKIGRDIGRLEADVETCINCKPRDPVDLVCTNCTSNIITDWLTSGYYSGENREKPGEWKCSHGGPWDKSTPLIKGGGINKDTRLCELSPHSDWHDIAVQLAKDATSMFIRDVITDSTPERMQALFGGQPHIAVALSNEENYGTAIYWTNLDLKALKKRARFPADMIYFLQPLASISSASDCTTTTNPDDFATTRAGDTLRKRTNGKGEQLRGLRRAISKIPSGASFFIYTQNPSALSCPVSAKMAANRNIRIFAVLDPRGDTPALPHSLVAYLSGGETVSLEHAAVLQEHFKSNHKIATIFKYRNTASDAHEVMIDSSLRNILFTGPGPVFGPDGECVTTNKVTEKLKAGMYTATGPITVTAETDDVVIADFNLLQLAGRDGHQGLFPASHISSNSSYTGVVSLLEPISSRMKEIKFSLGDVVLDMKPDATAPNTFFAENIVVPAGEHFFTVSGEDDRGHAFARQYDVPIVSSAMLVSVSEYPTMNTDDIAEYTVTVGGGVEGTYNVKAVIVGSEEAKVLHGGGDGQVIDIPRGRDASVMVKVLLNDIEHGAAHVSIVITRQGIQEVIVIERNLPWRERAYT